MFVDEVGLARLRALPQWHGECGAISRGSGSCERGARSLKHH